MNGILANGFESGNNKPCWKNVNSRKQEIFGISALKSNGNVNYIYSIISINVNPSF